MTDEETHAPGLGLPKRRDGVAGRWSLSWLHVPRCTEAFVYKLGWRSGGWVPALGRLQLQVHLVSAK